MWTTREGGTAIQLLIFLAMKSYLRSNSFEIPTKKIDVKGKDWYGTHPWCNSCEVIHSLRQVQCRIKVRVRWSLTCTLLTGPAGLSSFYSACSWLLLSHAAAADVADDDISLLLHSLVSWLPAAAGSYWSEGWSCHLQATPEGPDSICTLQAMDTPHLLWINKTSLRE